MLNCINCCGMNCFRQINQRSLLLWSLFLSLSLLSAQGVGLHVHNLDHGHDEHPNEYPNESSTKYHSHTHTIDEADSHNHLSKAHFSHDTSHNDHHDGTASEVDLSPDGVLKNTHSNIFAIALFAFFFTLIPVVSSGQFMQRCRDNKLTIKEYYLFSPPLRAPPQH